MSTHLPENAFQALQRARGALQQGDKQAARRWAWKAVKFAPEYEEPWLYLATVSDPHASAAYLKKALEINPDSERARKGMHWVAERLRSSGKNKGLKRGVFSLNISSDALVRNRPAFLPWSVTAIILLLSLFVWLWTPEFSSALQAPPDTPQPSQAASQASLLKASYTPTPTATFTPTPTFTPSPTPTKTPTATPRPTRTQKPPAKKRISLPGANSNERWFDLDLSSQRLYAYQGNKLVNSFVVSTGTWLTPTVTGKYRIYVKYRYTDMAGPGYYLPDVPFTMYFYNGYGIHGTYWHNNFGTPMSHGCVNMRTSDARWAYNWASVGTIVNIHY